MDINLYLSLKSKTREDMRQDGIICENRQPPQIPPEELENRFFTHHSTFSAITHEFEANSSGMHRHLHFELVYVVSGSCKQELEDGVVLSLHRGNMLIMNPLAKHRCLIQDVEDNIVTLAIQPSLFNATFFSFFEGRNSISEFFINYMVSINSKNYILFDIPFAPDVDGTIAELIAVYLHGGTFVTPELKCLLILLFIRLMKNQSEHHRQEDSIQLSSIISYMSAHLGRISLESCAEHFHFHPNYLSNLIKKQSGRSFTSILTELKIIQARYYLSNTDLPIAKISELLGYQDPPSFNTMFRKNVGITPSAYRKLNTVI